MTLPAAEDDRRGAGLELFLISFVSLYLELFIIRWLSAEVRLFTVFRTFPLIACFVGLGFGCALGTDKRLRWFPLAILAAVSIVKALSMTGLNHSMFPSVSLYSWQNLASINLSNVLICAACVLITLAGPFLAMICVGARLGRLFNQFKPLIAYSINVAGAIAGSITFAILEYSSNYSGIKSLALVAIMLYAFSYFFYKREQIQNSSVKL